MGLEPLLVNGVCAEVLAEANEEVGADDDELSDVLDEEFTAASISTGPFEYLPPPCPP